MSNPQSFPETEAPQELSPESRALLKRARRSFGFSVGLLLLGFMAIGAALVYRATRDDGTGSASEMAEELRLPQGAEIVSAVAADGSVSVTYRIGAETQMRVFDAATGEVTAEIGFASE